MKIGTRTLSVFKLISLGLLLVCFVMTFLPWITTRMGMGDLKLTENLYGASGGRCFWGVMLAICTLLFFLALVLAAAGIILDRSLWALPVSALGFTMFLLDLFTVLWLKGYYARIMGGEFFSSDAFSVHVGIGAWLFLFFVLNIYGLLFLEDRLNKRSSFGREQFRLSDSTPRRSKNDWTCPNCGELVYAEMKFCESCGAGKPEPPRCPACGILVKSDEAFCSNCGTRLH